MTTQHPHEFYEGLFIQGAFKHIQTYYFKQFNNEAERLSFACKLIHEARDRFLKALSQGKLEAEALVEVDLVFTSKIVVP